MAYEARTENENEVAVASTKREDSLVVKLRHARRRYASTFTMHAVEHILNGNMAEKIFWSLKLSACLGIAIYLSSKLFMSFFNHDVDTKIVVDTQDRLQFPMIMIGGSGVYSFLKNAKNNCSSNQSVSYDESICKLLNQDCPNMLIENLATSGDATVSCDVLGQFVVINADGKSHQTPMLNSLEIWVKNVDVSDLPLLLLIETPSMRPDGKVDGSATPKSLYDFMVIDKIGHYRYPLERTTITRLPYPYSKPSCIEEHSEDAKTKNIFRGNYSTGSCISTCRANAEISLCKTMSTLFRHFLRDDIHLKKHFEDQPMANITRCFEEKEKDFEKVITSCINECQSPCFEQSYKANEFYKKGEKNVIHLAFYYEQSKETYIRQVPRNEVENLLSSFGGQLGLMVGMSAVSLVEVLIWSLLLQLEYLCRIVTSEKYMDTLLTENKMRLPLDLG